MRRILVVVVALSVAGGPAGAAAQELGHVFVEVLDRAGRPVPGLTAADFALQENNVDLDVVSVRRGTPRPMSIALLVDNGGRVAAPAERDALREGLAAFLRTLPPRHEVSIHTIRGRVRRVVGPTTDRGDLDDAIGRVRVGARARVGLLESVREVSERRYDDDQPFRWWCWCCRTGTRSAATPGGTPTCSWPGSPPPASWRTRWFSSRGARGAAPTGKNSRFPASPET